MLELTLDAVCDHLVISMWMQRPDRTWRERIIIEDPQGAEVHVARILVFAEAEVPSAMEGAILYFTPGLVNTFRRSDRDHYNIYEL
jgi:hypothetical protein